MKRPASNKRVREGSAERVVGRFHGCTTPAFLASTFFVFLLFAGCTGDEPPVSQGGSETDSGQSDVTLHLWDSQTDLEQVEERLRDSRYPLASIANPDPNQYGADGGRALRCDLVGVDLFFWTFDDESKAREAGERWEGEAGPPLRWTVAGNLLLVLFSDDDFTGVSAEAAGELERIFTAGGDGATGGEG
jgi:hypothetical protein